MSDWSDFTEAPCWGGHPVARSIAEAAPRRRVVVTGVISATRVTEECGTPAYECLLDDGCGELRLRFGGRRNVAGLDVGVRCTVEGTARGGDSQLVVWNPIYRIEPVATGDDRPGRSHPSERAEDRRIHGGDRRRGERSGRELRTTPPMWSRRRATSASTWERPPV